MAVQQWVERMFTARGMSGSDEDSSSTSGHSSGHSFRKDGHRLLHSALNYLSSSSAPYFVFSSNIDGLLDKAGFPAGVCRHCLFGTVRLVVDWHERVFRSSAACSRAV